MCNPNSQFPLLLTIASGALILTLFYDYSKFGSSIKRPNSSSDVLKITRSPGKLFQLSPQNTTFKDIAGMFNAKEEVEELVDFLKNKRNTTN